MIETIEKISDLRKGKAITFDSALTMTKFGKFNYFIIFISGVVLTTVLLETLGISFVLPVAQCDLKLTTEDKGVLSAIAFVGIITSSHLWGFLADTKGRRKVIVPTLMAAFGCTILSSFTTKFWLFAILRYFTGFFISGSSATIYAFLGEFNNLKNRSRAIMGASVVFGFGCMSLPGIAWLVINQDWEFYIPVLDLVYKPWRLFLVVCGLPSFLCGLILLKIPESPKFVFHQGKHDETLDILRWIYNVNTGNDTADLKITRIIEEREAQQTKDRRAEIANSKGGFQLLKLMWEQTAPLFMNPHLKTTIIACTLQFGIFATSNGMYMWFPDILNRMAEYMEDHPNNLTTICKIVYETRVDLSLINVNSTNLQECNEKLDISTYEHSLVLEIMYAIGFALIGLIINAIGKLPILVFCLFGCGVCGLATAYVNIPLLGIYLYLILLLCGLSVTVVNAATIDLFPTNLRAMAVCISLMFGRLGSVVGANIVGVFLDYNCELTFIMSGTSLIACAMLSFFIPNICKNSDRTPRLSVSSSIGQ